MEFFGKNSYPILMISYFLRKALSWMLHMAKMRLIDRITLSFMFIYLGVFFSFNEKITFTVCTKIELFLPFLTL